MMYRTMYLQMHSTNTRLSRKRGWFEIDLVRRLIYVFLADCIQDSWYLFPGQVWFRCFLWSGRLLEGMEGNGWLVALIFFHFYIWRYSILGKYVGNRPVKLKKADDTAIRPVEIGHRKAKKLEQDLKKNRHKPYWSWFGRSKLDPSMYICLLGNCWTPLKINLCHALALQPLSVFLCFLSLAIFIDNGRHALWTGLSLTNHFLVWDEPTILNSTD